MEPAASKGAVAGESNEDNLKRELQMVQENLQEARRNCEEIRNEYDDKLREKEIIISRLAKREGKVQKLEAQNAELNQTLQTVKAELEIRTGDLKDIQQKHQRTTKELEEAQHQWNLERENSRKKENETRARLTQTANELIQELEAVSRTSQQRENALKAAEAAAEEQIERKDLVIAGLSKFAASASKLSQENARLTQSVDQLQWELQALRHTSEERENVFTDNRRELENLRGDLQKLRQDCDDKDERIQGLKREAVEWLRQQESTAVQLREALTAGSNLKSEDARLTQTVQQLQQDLQAARHTSEERENAFRAAEAAVQEVIERKDLIIAGLGRAAAKVSELSQENDGLRQEGKGLQRALESQRQTCMDREKNITELEESLSQLRQSDGDNRSALRQMQDERQHHLEKAEQAETLEEQVQELRQQLAAQDDRVRHLKDELQSKNSELEAYRSSLGGMNGAFARLSRSINDHEDQEKRLQQEISQHRGEVQRLQADNTRLSRLNDEMLLLRGEAASLRGRNENHERVRDDFERQLQQTRDTLLEKERAIARLEVEVETGRKAQTQLSTIRKHEEQLQFCVNQQQNEVDYNAQIVRDHQARLQNMQQQLDECERQRLRSLREAQAQRDLNRSLEEKIRRLQSQLSNRNGPGTQHT